jgi:hypothetical protein
MRFILLLLLLAASTGAIAQHAGPELVSNDKTALLPVRTATGVYVSDQGDTLVSTLSPVGMMTPHPGQRPALIIDGKPASDRPVLSPGNGIAICTEGTPSKKASSELTKPVSSRLVVASPEGKQPDTTMVRKGIVIVK